MKKFISTIISAVMLVLLLPSAAFADNNLSLEELRDEYGAISIEAYNIGQGFLVEPSLFLKEGKSTGEITINLLEGKGIDYQGSISYFSGFQFDDTVVAEYPSYLEAYSGEFYSTGDGNGYLAEFDYSMCAGWCYSISDWWSSLGADSSYPGAEITDYNTYEQVTLGDVIRWHYSVYGYGSDCGFSSNVMAEYMGGNLFTQEDKSDLIFILAAINDYYGNLDADEVYETALAVAANPLATADEIAEQEAILTSYIENTYFDIASEFEITEYDGEKVYLTFPEENVDVIAMFVDYEGNRFSKVISEPVTTAKTDGENTMSVPIPSNITLSLGDKIILLNDYTDCMPLCKSYVINSQ